VSALDALRALVETLAAAFRLDSEDARARRRRVREARRLEREAERAKRAAQAVRLRDPLDPAP
jgi:hypothetical protein